LRDNTKEPNMIDIVRGQHTASLLIGGHEMSLDQTPLHNPARLTDVVGTVSNASAGLAAAAVVEAERAFAHWSSLKAARRAEVLTRVADAVEADAAALAILLTREHGKILADATTEVANTVRTLRYYADLADYVEHETRIYDHRGTIIQRRVPMGPVAVIVPWNYPVLLATLMIAPALAAGNTVVVKLPDHAPLTLSAVLRHLNAHAPAGVVNVVAGSGDTVGVALTTHPDVRKVSFTGSTVTGRTIMRDASINLKNLGLELGGNDPAIVTENAEITTDLIDELVRGTFMTSGQVCYAPKRLYVHSSHYTQFVEAFTAAAAELVVGDGLDPDVTMGPLNNAQQRRIVTGLIKASRAEGARIRQVGSFRDIDPSQGYFVLPTIVTGLTQQSPLVRQEQFGPIIPILAFDTDEQAVAMANDSEYGLAASVWSADSDHAFALARRIQAGSVFVNIHRVGASDVSMPFGGFKQSGLGRGHGHSAVDESMEVQVLADRLDMHHS
jgi:aldehyde dehydrogenase